MFRLNSLDRNEKVLMPSCSQNPVAQDNFAARRNRQVKPERRACPANFNVIGVFSTGNAAMNPVEIA